MAYRLKLQESVPQGIKRVVKEEFETALEQLNGKSRANRGEAVHEARKSVKKIRAVLRLIRSELDGAYDAEIGRLRTRDAGAVVETFDALRKKYRDDLRKHSLDSVRRRLVKVRDDAEKKVESGNSFGKLVEIRQFLRRMKHLWLAWQSQPKSLEREEEESDSQKQHTGKGARKKYRASVKLKRSLWGSFLSWIATG